MPAGRQRVPPGGVLQREGQAETPSLLEIVVGEARYEANRRVPRHHRQPGPPRRDLQRHETAEARAQQAQARGETGMVGQRAQHRLDVLDARGDRRVLLDSARLAAAAEVEATQGPRPAAGRTSASRRYLSLSFEADRPWQATTSGTGRSVSGTMQHQGQGAVGNGNPELLTTVNASRDRRGGRRWRTAATSLRRSGGA